jgi:hypothetical protein
LARVQMKEQGMHRKLRYVAWAALALGLTALAGITTAAPALAGSSWSV